MNKILRTDYKLIDVNDKEYPLEIEVKIKKSNLISETIRYYCSVYFPPDYPNTEFHKYSISEHKNKVAYIEIKYSIDKKILNLENFYVYSNFDKIKDRVNRGEILKGFGKYMFCKILSAKY